MYRTMTLTRVSVFGVLVYRTVTLMKRTTRTALMSYWSCV